MTLLHESAAALGRAIAAREVSSVEVVGETIDRLDRFNDSLNAVIWRNDAEALAQAAEADRAVARDDELRPSTEFDPDQRAHLGGWSARNLRSLGVSDEPRPQSDASPNCFARPPSSCMDAPTRPRRVRCR